MEKKLDNRLNFLTKCSIESVWKSIHIRYKCVFFSTLIWGILSHGIALFNKYAVHDEVTFQFDVGYTYQSGRWGLGLISEFMYLIFKTHFSLPLINGVLSIVFIAISACLIVKLFEIDNLGICVVLSGALVSIPVISVTFGFMFTAPYYMFSFLITTYGVYLISLKNKWYTYVFGIILISFSIGIYQAYISIAISLMLFRLMYEVKNNSFQSWGGFLKKCGLLIIACVLFVGLYLLITKATILFLDIELTGHQGISSMASEGLSVYFKRAILAYVDFFIQKRDLATVYISSLKYLVFVVVFLTVICISIIIANLLKKNKNNGFQFLLLSLFVPLVVNFIEVMSNPDIMYEIMLYGQTMLFVCLSWLLNDLPIKTQSVKKVFVSFGILIIAFFSVVWCRFDNALYLKAEFEQQRAISYFTTLVTQIKSTENYSDDIPIAFVGDKKDDHSVSGIEEMNWVSMAPYSGVDRIINDYAWKDYMTLWTGYSPTYANSDDYADLKEVKDMPVYPDYGSIKRIDDVIIIKLE